MRGRRHRGRACFEDRIEYKRIQGVEGSGVAGYSQRPLLNSMLCKGLLYFITGRTCFPVRSPALGCPMVWPGNSPLYPATGAFCLLSSLPGPEPHKTCRTCDFHLPRSFHDSVYLHRQSSALLFLNYRPRFRVPYIAVIFHNCPVG